LVDLFSSLLPLRRAIKVLVAYAVLVESFSYFAKKVDILAKHQSAVLIFRQLLDQRDQCPQLRAVIRSLRKNQTRMTTNSAQTRDLSQHLKFIVHLPGPSPQLIVDLAA